MDKARECARKVNQPVVLDTTKHARSSSTTDVSNQSQKWVKTSQLSIRPYTYKLNDLPFSPTEQAVVQAQALQAVISTNSAFGLFEDPEMQELFRLMWTAAPSVLPSGKLVGGKLLNDTTHAVERDLTKILKNKDVGLV